jgi:hypothetical protein
MKKSQIKKLIQHIIFENLNLNEGFKSSYVLPHKGVTIFWDFYGLYTAWYLYGSGHSAYYPKDEFNPTTKPIPHKIRNTIDEMFSSCLHQLSRKMLVYLQNACILEFKYSFKDDLGGFGRPIEKIENDSDSDYNYSNITDEYLENLYERYSAFNQFRNIKKPLFIKMCKLWIVLKKRHANLGGVGKNMLVSHPKILDCLKEAGITFQDIRDYFLQGYWDSDFGGKNWANIVEAYLELESKIESAEEKDLMTLIDKIYDMEHNTGNVLNKGDLDVDSYYLDARAEAKNLSDILSFAGKYISNDVSRLLKTIVLYSQTEKDKIYYSGKFYDSEKDTIDPVDLQLMKLYGY